MKRYLDKLGQEIKVGDWIAIHNTYYAGVQIGKVTKLIKSGNIKATLKIEGYRKEYSATNPILFTLKKTVHNLDRILIQTCSYPANEIWTDMDWENDFIHTDLLVIKPDTYNKIVEADGNTKNRNF
jgi:hypothetical protein